MCHLLAHSSNAYRSQGQTKLETRLDQTGVKSQQVYLGLLHGWLGCFLGSALARNQSWEPT